MTAAAAGGAVCDFLYIFKCVLYVFKPGFLVQCIFHICIGYMLAVADCIVFHQPKYRLSRPWNAQP